MAASAEQAEALWYVAPGKAEIRSERLAPVSPGQARLRAVASALSRGTERLIFSGRVPESEFERMRAPFMSGAFPFPVKYGYAMVGRVEEGPADLEGRLVFALYPHQTVFNLPAENILPLPDGLPPERAVLAANMETALNATWDAAPGPAGRIAVVGAGVLGLLVARLCARMPDTSVVVVDIEPSRAAIAAKLGLAFAAPGAAPQDCDLVIHTSASEAGLRTALDLAANEATVLELSWYGANDVRVPLGGAFHSRRLKLVSSQVGQVAPSRRAQFTHRDRLKAALDLLAADPALDALLAPPVAFAELPAKLPDILNPTSGVLCQLIRY
ncbi:MAG: zinc-binding alcohol dehydrogenase [Alphaproteobacteria bacterium]|nr:MAG: zinc-binding alcohol dehydrogenase [Alphaproteobacteria bacterium]